MASIRKRKWTNKDGEQVAWIADYTDQAGKRHIKTFGLRKDADTWMVAARSEVARGVHTAESASITVAQAGKDWIAQGRADGLEESTLMQYRQHLDYHIVPFVGTVKLAQLTPAAVQEFRNRLHVEKRSRAMVNRAVGSLGAILAHAMATGGVARNVVREQGRKRHRRVEKRQDARLQVGIDIPTKDEMRAMLATAKGRWRPLIITAIFTGLRASELRGLRWVDVDLDRAELTVRQRADRWNKIGPPKSDAGKRSVPLAPMVINALKEWKLACPPGELDLVFPNGKGLPQQITSIHYRGLGPLQLAAGITDAATPKYGMHSLRHAAASLFIEQGFTPKRVQALMGHSTIQMTFDTYGHLFPTPDDDRVAMRDLQARLVG